MLYIYIYLSQIKAHTWLEFIFFDAVGTGLRVCVCVFFLRMCAFMFRVLLGDTVSSDKLEGSGPDHLWRACAGRHFSCPAGKEHSYSLPLRKDAPHYQEKRGTLCLQDRHLGMFFDIKYLVI